VSLPPKVLLLNGVEVPVHYELEKPETSEVIFQNSVGIGYEYSGPRVDSSDTGFIFKTSLFRKPDNQMFLGYAGSFNLEKDSIDARVKPMVGYQKIGGIDLYYQYHAYQFGFSAMSETSESPTYDSEWTYQTFKPTQYLSPAISWKYGSKNIELRYLQITGGEMIPLGLRSSVNPIDSTKSDLKVLPTRNLYAQAIKSSIQWSFYFMKRILTPVTVSYTHEFQDNGDIIGFEQGLYFRSRYKLYYGADLIASSANSSNNFESLASRYHFNDRAYLGMTYVF
jgi:hypothetical protein